MKSRLVCPAVTLFLFSSCADFGVDPPRFFVGDIVVLDFIIVGATRYVDRRRSE
jgi:hypothetical protein